MCILKSGTEKKEDLRSHEAELLFFFLFPDGSIKQPFSELKCKLTMHGVSREEHVETLALGGGREEKSQLSSQNITRWKHRPLEIVFF